MIVNTIKVSDQTRREVEKRLLLYYEFKCAILCGEKVMYPNLVPSYEQKNEENKDVPLLRDIGEILGEKFDMEDSVKESMLREIYKLIQRYRPEYIQYDSTTQRAAFDLMSPEFMAQLNFKKKYVEYLDEVISTLPELQRKIIYCLYLAPYQERMKPADIIENLQITWHTFKKEKKEAIDSIAVKLNLI